MCWLHLWREIRRVVWEHLRLVTMARRSFLMGQHVILLVLSGVMLVIIVAGVT